MISEDDTMDDLTLQQYLDLFKKPLSEPEMEAILELTDLVKEKKKKKRLPKKELPGKKKKVPNKSEANIKAINKIKKSKKTNMAPLGASASKIKKSKKSKMAPVGASA
jgi:hypothetical protein